jgi:hypothetical protein
VQGFLDREILEDIRALPIGIQEATMDKPLVVVVEVVQVLRVLVLLVAEDSLVELVYQIRLLGPQLVN